MVAREIKQAHYWGMVAAFSRSKNVDTPKGAGLAESAIGGFSSFANLKKETQRARLVFFNGRSVDEKWPDDGTKEADDPALYLVPPPSGKAKPEAPSQPRFSRRQELARAVTEDNPLLARATVNRVWALLFGRGLVHPVELMDSKHPASHPELLDWLAADFASHGHDVRRLIRILASTRAYALDSRPAAKRGAVRPPAPDAFARSLTRPISAEQLARSLVIATGSGQPDPTLGNALARQFPDLFASEYNASLQQAMFLSNSPEFDRLLADAPGSLVQRMGPLKSPADRVRVAFSAVLGRPPEPDELREATRYLADRPEPAGNRQLVWSLLTSAEFLLNH